MILSGMLIAELKVQSKFSQFKPEGSVKEPSGLLPGKDKRPDGLTLVLWQGGRSLAWDATVVDILAPSYVVGSAQITSSVAQTAAERKVSKYVGLSASHIFISIAIETLGPMNEAGDSFLFELGRHLSNISDNPRETFFLSSISRFLYRGLTKLHSEALLLQKHDTMSSRFSPLLT